MKLFYCIHTPGRDVFKNWQVPGAMNCMSGIIPQRHAASHQLPCIFKLQKTLGWSPTLFSRCTLGNSGPNQNGSFCDHCIY